MCVISKSSLEDDMGFCPKGIHWMLVVINGHTVCIIGGVAR